MADTKKATKKRKPLDERRITTDRYIDDAEGITVTKRPEPSKNKKKTK